MKCGVADELMDGEQGGDLYQRVCEGMFGEAQKAVNTLTSDTASKHRNSGGKKKEMR